MFKTVTYLELLNTLRISAKDCLCREFYEHYKFEKIFKLSEDAV
jgi:hypothetical protein